VKRGRGGASRPADKEEATVNSAAPLRFGLAGTGYWARVTHAPALASTEGVEFVAVWGRNEGAARALAAEHGAASYADFGAFLAEVDGVAFAVPPDVQAAMAARAAAAGKHLLLEKPIATSAAAGNALVKAVEAAQVGSVVFFTLRFQADVRAWLADVTSGGGRWSGGDLVWLGSSLRESSPFNTPWRREKGGLWDLGPHAISLLWAGLGPVGSVTADAGPADVAHLVLHHRSGTTSTVTVSQSAPAAAEGFGCYLWGDAGRSAAPGVTSQPVTQLRVALAELAGNARSGQTAHPCDVRFGQDVVYLLAEAERQLAGRRR
jgi:predicted dehydrogenase